MHQTPVEVHRPAKRPNVLAPGILNVSKKLGSFVHEMVAAAEQIPGSSHSGGINVSLGQHAAPQQDGNFVGIDFVVFGFAAVDGFHVEGMSENERDFFFFTQIRNPVPGKNAFHRHNDVFPERFNGQQEMAGSGFHIPAQADIIFLVKDAEIHFAGVQVNAAIEFVLSGIKIHLVSSLGYG